jgi:hypothetical protein
VELRVLHRPAATEQLLPRRTRSDHLAIRLGAGARRRHLARRPAARPHQQEQGGGRPPLRSTPAHRSARRSSSTAGSMPSGSSSAIYAVRLPTGQRSRRHGELACTLASDDSTAGSRLAVGSSYLPRARWQPVLPSASGGTKRASRLEVDIARAGPVAQGQTTGPVTRGTGVRIPLAHPRLILVSPPPPRRGLVAPLGRAVEPLVHAPEPVHSACIGGVNRPGFSGELAT